MRAPTSRLLAVFLLLCSSAAAADNGPYDSTRPARKSTTEERDGRRKKGRTLGTPSEKTKKNLPETAFETPAQVVEDERMPAGAPSPWLPSWGRPGFDWTLGPLIGFRYESAKSDAGSTTRNSSEIGLRGGLSDIALIPANPGLGLSLRAAQAWGATSALTIAGNERSTDTVTFTRSVAGIKLSAYYGWLRQELGFVQGRIVYADKGKTHLQSTELEHDLGILVLSWLSAHYTLDLLRAYEDSYSEAVLVQHDHWLHIRLFTSILRMYLDFGPGQTHVKEYKKDTAGKSELFATGTTQDLRALAGLHLFWKIGASGEIKYVFHATSRQLGSEAGLRLPAEDLSQLSPLALPEDSLRASLFAGISDLAYGLNVGWRYNLEILNMGSKNGNQRRERRTQGPAVGFAASF